MKRIYTYGGRPARRNLTVADMIALKGNVTLCQTCPANEEEAAACAEVGIDVLNTSDADLPAVRAGAPETFTIADLPMTAHQTSDDILRAAVTAAEAGADAVYTPRSLAMVEMLAGEGLAVQGHLGLVPRLSTQRGGLRIIGRTADEAIELAKDFRRLEDAGAYAAEVECVATEALAVIAPARSWSLTRSARDPQVTSSSCFSWTSAESPNGLPPTPEPLPIFGRFGKSLLKNAVAPSASTGLR